MTFKVIYGPPCSGKSTYVKEHKGTHDVVYDYDSISDALTYEDTRNMDDRQYSHRFAMACRGAVVSVVREGDHEADNVWLLLTNLTNNVREWIADCDPEYIRMDVTEEECLERLENDDTRQDKEKWSEIIRKWFEDHGEEEERMATPNDKIKLKDQAQARSLAVLAPIGEEKQRIESSHYVEGYADRFEPYVLWEDEDGPVYERFDPGCFAGADMSDIILQYDHQGRVFARTGNGTLVVDVDENGLRMCADLSKTEGSRQLYEDIKAGMITKMSWRFTCGDYDYDPETRTICHHTVKKVWDVSAVSIPANQDTEINARDFIHGEMERIARREAELEERKRKLRIKLKLMED